MKVAVASTDGKTISMHFGRSKCFIVFEVADGKIAGQQVRDNAYTAHAKGECDGEQHHHDENHSHADVAAALSDCQVLLCGGMGWRAAEDLKAQGIRAVMVDASLEPQQAVAAMLAGTLQPGPGFCRCHH